VPRVSVIIPTYNRSFLCERAVKSVLDQTYTDFEVIVADDGSTDETRRAIEHLSDKIRYLCLEHHGRSRARNRAIAKARGEYIAFLDSDDIFLPHTLARQVEHLDKNPDYGMVYGQAICFGENADVLHIYQTGGSGWLYHEIAFLLPLTIVLCSVMVRRTVLEKVGGFDEQMERFEDTDMWRRISRQAQILAINEPLCKILSHDGNAMQHPRREFGCLRYYVRKIFDEDRDIDKAFRKRGAARLYHHYCKAVREAYPKSWTASIFALWAIFYQPLQPLYYRYLLPGHFWQLRGVRLFPSLKTWMAGSRFILLLRFSIDIFAFLLANPSDFFRRLKKRLTDGARSKGKKVARNG